MLPGLIGSEQMSQTFTSISFPAPGSGGYPGAAGGYFQGEATTVMPRSS